MRKKCEWKKLSQLDIYSSFFMSVALYLYFHLSMFQQSSLEEKNIFALPHTQTEIFQKNCLSPQINKQNYIRSP